MDKAQQITPQHTISHGHPPAASDQKEDTTLDAFEVRVLAVLAEKEALTPDNYPLSLNALTNGCNQLSSRDPVMSLSEDTVTDVLARLKSRRLISEVNQVSARVTKYEHRMRIQWVLEQDKLAILMQLCLRGPQTLAELKARTERMHPFASIDDVEAALQFLIDKYPPFAAKLPKAPGTKEPRYAQLLEGEHGLTQYAVASTFAGNAHVSTLKVDRMDRIAALEKEVDDLKQQVQTLASQFTTFQKQFE